MRVSRLTLTTSVAKTVLHMPTDKEYLPMTGNHAVYAALNRGTANLGRGLTPKEVIVGLPTGGTASAG